MRRNYLPEDLWPILEENRFDGCVVVQANTVIEETWWLLELAAAHAFILGVVAWVDLTDPGLPRVLDELQRHPKFKGVRHLVHDEPDTRWLLRPDVLRGLRELAGRKIPYDLLLRPDSFAAGAGTREQSSRAAHGNRPHCEAVDCDRTQGWLGGGYASGSRGAEPLLQVIGNDHRSRPRNWTADDLRPYVQHVLSLFEPERLMFGSDWPVCKLAGSWKRVLAAFTQAIGPQSMAVREQLLGGTATRFYRL